MAVRDKKPYPLTQKEINLVEALRERSLPFGRIPCIIYFQDALMERVVFTGNEESVKL